MINMSITTRLSNLLSRVKLNDGFLAKVVIKGRSQKREKGIPFRSRANAKINRTYHNLSRDGQYNQVINYLNNVDLKKIIW